MRNRLPSAALVDRTSHQFAEALKLASCGVGLPLLAIPYQMRHTGASTDFGTGDRSIVEIRRRGRWRSDTSVRRYEKGSQLTRVLSQLPASTQRYCVTAARCMPRVLCGRLEPMGP